MEKIIALEDFSASYFQGANRISSWHMKNKEIEDLFADFNKIKSKEVPLVLDVGCGSGLAGYLFSRQGCKVIAIDQYKETQNYHLYEELSTQFSSNSQNINFFTNSDFKSIYKQFVNKQVDVIFCSWMSIGENLTNPYFKKINPNMIVHVIGKGGVTGLTEANHKTFDYVSPGTYNNHSGSYDLLSGYTTVKHSDTDDFRGENQSMIRIDVKNLLVKNYNT